MNDLTMLSDSEHDFLGSSSRGVRKAEQPPGDADERRKRNKA